MRTPTATKPTRSRRTALHDDPIPQADEHAGEQAGDALADVIPIEHARSRRARSAPAVDVDNLAAARLDLLEAMERLDGARARVGSRLDAVEQQMRDHGVDPDSGVDSGQPPAG